MLKKLTSFVATFALLAAGFGSLPASAATVTTFADPAGLAQVANRVTIQLDSTSQVAIAKGNNFQSLMLSTAVTKAFMATLASQTITITTTLTDPNGASVAMQSNGNMMPPTGTTYSANPGALLSGGCSTPNAFIPPMYNLTLPSDTSNCDGSFYETININALPNQTILDGTYTATMTLVANGTPIAAGTAGVTPQKIMVTQTFTNTSFTSPANATSYQLGAAVCIDTTKLSLNDVVKAEIWVDNAKSNDWANFNSRSGSYGNPGFRMGGGAQSMTLTSYDLANGVYASISSSPSLTPGSHVVQYRVWDDTTSTDVSTSCAPAKPTAPVLSFTGTTMSAPVTASAGVSNNGMLIGICTLYDTADLTTPVAKVASQMSGMSSNSCTFTSGFVVNHTYKITFKDAFFDLYSAESDLSNAVTVTPPGFSVTSSYAGTKAAGKIMLVNNNTIPVDSTAGSVITFPDGSNGYYQVGIVSAGLNMGPMSAVHVSHVTSAGFDSSFGNNSGTLSFSPTGYTMFSTIAGFAYFGANSDKWVISVVGMTGSGMSMAGMTQLFFGSKSSSTITSVTVTNSLFDTACANASAGYGVAMGTWPGLTPLSGPTSNPNFVLNCSKRVTFSDSTSGVLGLPVLLSVGTDGTPSTATALATPSAGANDFTIAGQGTSPGMQGAPQYTFNPNAASGTPMYTFVVRSMLATSFSNMNYQLVESDVSKSLVRVDSTLTRVGTDTSVTFDAGAVITWPSISGSTIYAIQRTVSAGVSTYKLVTIATTGAPTVSAALDLSGSGLTSPSLTVIVGATPDSETLLYLFASSASGSEPAFLKLSDNTLTYGEKIVTTFSPGPGVISTRFLGADKNVYWAFTDAASSTYQTLLKWIDPRWTAPLVPAPTVTSTNLKYALNTPASGTKITLTGTNLDGVTAATIGGVAAAIGTKTTTTLELTVPNATTSGAAGISLTNGGGTYDNLATLTYVGTGVAQTVTLGALPSSPKVGDTDGALSATVAITPSDAGTVSSVVWSSTTTSVCTIVSGKVHYVAAGTCNLTATAAANGLLLAGTASGSITVAAATQTITLTAPANPQVDLDGIDLTASVSSGLALTFTTSTPSVCAVDDTGHVTAAVPGDCVVTASQAGNSSYAAASQMLTITFAALDATPVVDNGDPAQPVVTPKTGAWVAKGDTGLAWNRTKGTLAVRVKSMYVGQITATLTFRSGTKNLTCSVKFGLTKAQKAVKTQIFTSGNFCSAAAEKTQLAALKKLAANTTVTVKIVFDQRAALTFSKVRTKTKTMYIKLG